MAELPRQALVGAFGGTYISLATIDIDQLTITNFALLDAASYSSPMEAIRRYLKSIPRCPNMVALSIAGTVERDTATMAHQPWAPFDRDDIRAVTDADKVCFVNEFDALALAMPHMTRYELIQIGDGIVPPGGRKAIVSAGTGLGTASLSLLDGQWRAISGNSGLATLPVAAGDGFPFGDLAGPDGFVQASRVLCGAGLVATYIHLGGKAKVPTPKSITATGLEGTDKIARAALEQMAVWLGRFAGEVALHFGAKGGVYLAGGLPTGIVEALQTGSFRKAFDGSGERQAFLKDVGVFALKAAADPGLRGAAIALANSLPKTAPTYHRMRA